MYHVKNKKKNELSDAEAARLFEEARNQLQERVSLEDTDASADSHNVELDVLREGTSANKAESSIEFHTVPLDKKESLAT